MSGEGLAGQAGAEQPGLVLQRARETAGITQREIADALHLPISTIDAIEQDDQTQLPAEVFTKGYVRAYAKLLEIDPDPLVGALTPQASEAEDSESSVADNTPAGAGLEFKNLLSQPVAMVGVAVVLLGVAMLVVFGGGGAGDNEHAGEVASPVQSEPVSVGQTSTPLVSQAHSELEAEPAAELVADSFVASVPAEAEDLEPLPEPTSHTVNENGGAPTAILAADDPAPESAPITGSPTPDPADPARRLTPAGDDRLALVFSEDCWVEIKDAAGVKLYGDLGRAGQSIEFVGAGPFRVLLGYAPGVVLRFNAEPIALTPHTRNNVANLVLGQ